MALIPILAVFSAGADQASELDARLEALKATIGSIEQRLSADRRERDTLAADLAGIEKELATISRRRRETRTALVSAEARLAELEREDQALSDDLATNRRRLAAQLRAAYAMGRQSHLKLWLNQEDPGRLGRALVYYAYFNRARAEQIAATVRALDRLVVVRREAEASRQELARLNGELTAQAEAYGQRRDQRQALLDTIEARVSSGQRELGDAKAERARLEQLLKDLEAALADFPEAFEARPFEDLRGRLSWPVTGPFLRGPGQAKGGGMHRAGALIEAAAGSEVRAVSGGRVAFADWLRGFGLLMIVDHGDGYMTLYAFNESLFKEIGDWVEAGDLLAAVGDSGGQERPGLYFELRKDGHPIDLAPWFAKPRPE